MLRVHFTTKNRISYRAPFTRDPITSRTADKRIHHTVHTYMRKQQSTHVANVGHIDFSHSALQNTDRAWVYVHFLTEARTYTSITFFFFAAEVKFRATVFAGVDRKLLNFRTKGVHHRMREIKAWKMDIRWAYKFNFAKFDLRGEYSSAVL